MALGPPAGSLCISTVDMHTGGEPLRIVTDGLPELEGRTVLEKRRYFREQFDHLRTGLMFEPRGHADMYGAVLTRLGGCRLRRFLPSQRRLQHDVRPRDHRAHQLVIEAGLVDKSDVSFNVPAGRIEARAHRAAGEMLAARPSATCLHSSIGATRSCDIDGFGNVRFDIAYGGAFYALVDAPALGLELDAAHYARLIDAGGVSSAPSWRRCPSNIRSSAT